MAMQLNGKQIEVDSQGSGDALVLVHGLGGTSNSWGAQARVLGRFFTVIRPDLEGSGRSALAGDSLSIESYVADLLALMEALEIASAHFAGHSMGTIVCQHLAALHPQRVRSLVLLGPVAEVAEPVKQALRDRAAKARAEGMAGIADAVSEAGTAAETKAMRPEIVAFTRELLMRQNAEGYARGCEALAAVRRADPVLITCPTLLITGDEDMVAPPAAARALAADIADARLLIIAGIGHQTTMEKAGLVSEAMLNFYFSR